MSDLCRCEEDPDDAVPLRPLVSIIIPTYNRATFLTATLRSVLAQTQTGYEIIVVDDGSTDETSRVVERYAGRVRHLYQPRCGLIAAVRNHGLRQATGTYIAFLDSDDLWLPAWLETQLAALIQQPAWGMVYCDGWFFDDTSGQDLSRTHAAVPGESGWIGPALLQRCFIQTPGVLVRRAVLEDVGFFCEDPKLCVGEDWELWLRIAAHYQIGFIATPLFRARLHAGNTRRDPWQNHEPGLAVIEHACAAAPQVYTPVKQRAVLSHYYRTINLLRTSGQQEEARDLFTRAMHIDPALLREVFHTAKSSQGSRQATLS
jgi:glycosyltransferase involved in cell wall biosynthesis